MPTRSGPHLRTQLPPSVAAALSGAAASPRSRMARAEERMSLFMAARPDMQPYRGASAADLGAPQYGPVFNRSGLRGLDYIPFVDSELMLPGAVQALADQVNGEVIRLNNDIQASEGTKQGAFRNNWHSFVVEWQNFYKRLADSFWERAGTANIDTLKDYARSKLVAWEKALADVGGARSGAGVTPREDPTKGSSADGLISLVKWGVGGAVALYVLVTFGPVLKGLATRLATPKPAPAPAPVTSPGTAGLRRRRRRRSR